jgi:murein tripeptide amidase MpaA
MTLLKTALFIVAASLPLAAGAQEGYPLDGTWRGEWGPSGGDQTLAVVVMNWDGTTINGRINPGRNTINFTSASLNPSDWSVHIEAQTREGEAIVINGVLSELGSYRRKLAGTWTSNGVENQLVLTRE